MDVFKTLEQQIIENCIYDNSVTYLINPNKENITPWGNCLDLSLWYQIALEQLGTHCGIFSTSLLPSNMGYASHVIDLGWDTTTKIPWFVDLTDCIIYPNTSKISRRSGNEITVCYGGGCFEYLSAEINAPDETKTLQRYFRKKRKRCLLYPIGDYSEKIKPCRLAVEKQQYILWIQEREVRKQNFVNGTSDCGFEQVVEKMFIILRNEKPYLPTTYEEMYCKNIQAFLDI